MLESFRLINYKAFSDTDTLRLAPITLLLGRNNSGKSAVLKSLSLLHDGLANGINSAFRLKTANGVIVGSSMVDLFHNRDITDMGFEVGMTDLKYEIHFLGQNGAAIPHLYLLQDNKSAREYSKEGASISDEIAGMFPTELADKVETLGPRMTFSVLHIGPIRVISPRLIDRNDAADFKFVGHNGEQTYSILLNSFLTDGKLLGEVSKWFETNLGVSIGFEAVDTGATTFRPYVERSRNRVQMADSGLGISQVLPVITQSYIPLADTVICIEQPALHLHPNAHEAVADRLAKSAKDLGMRYVLESHSKNVLYAFRYFVASPHIDFSGEDIAIYFTEEGDGESTVRPIKVYSDGSLSSWPVGVFGEDVDLLDKILDA